MEDMFRAFDQNLPLLNVGAAVPAINVAETANSIEVTAELPGVDEKDINVSLNENQLVISGEKKEETKKDEKDWHVETWRDSEGSWVRWFSISDNIGPASRCRPRCDRNLLFRGSVRRLSRHHSFRRRREIKRLWPSLLGTSGA